MISLHKHLSICIFAFKLHTQVICIKGLKISSVDLTVKYCSWNGVAWWWCFQNFGQFFFSSSIKRNGDTFHLRIMNCEQPGAVTFASNYWKKLAMSTVFIFAVFIGSFLIAFSEKTVSKNRCVIVWMNHNIVKSISSSWCSICILVLLQNLMHGRSVFVWGTTGC